MKSTMPKVFKIRHTEEIEYVLPVDSRDPEYDIFDTQSRIETWEPIRVKCLHRGHDGTEWIKVDFPSSGIGDLVLSSNAREKIGRFLERYGELLPLECEEGDFWTLNVTCVIDALDLEKSDVLWSSDPGRALMIHKYAFRAEALAQAMIFKIPEATRGPLLVTTPVVELINSSGLTGIVFKQIWALN